jgi:hypothetical protein
MPTPPALTHGSTLSTPGAWQHVPSDTTGIVWPSFSTTLAAGATALVEGSATSSRSSSRSSPAGCGSSIVLVRLRKKSTEPEPKGCF